MPTLRTFHPLVSAPQLGQLLKSSRRHKGLTQAQVGSRMGLSQNRVSHLEQHPETLSFEQLLAWCAALGLELQLGERKTPEASNPMEW